LTCPVCRFPWRAAGSKARFSYDWTPKASEEFRYEASSPTGSPARRKHDEFEEEEEEERWEHDMDSIEDEHDLPDGNEERGANDPYRSSDWEMNVEVEEPAPIGRRRRRAETISLLDDRVSALQNRNEALQRENRELREENEALREDVDRIRSAQNANEDRIQHLSSRVEELQKLATKEALKYRKLKEKQEKLTRDFEGRRDHCIR
jgi:FtsZ-binding cell division protein ZapB